MDHRFRKRPVVVEAFQLTARTRTDNTDWPDWLNRAWNLERGAPGSVYPQVEGDDCGWLCIATLEGERVAQFGDWIIRGVAGELYPCKPDIFAATYEPAGPDLSADPMPLEPARAFPGSGDPGDPGLGKPATVETDGPAGPSEG